MCELIPILRQIIFQLQYKFASIRFHLRYFLSKHVDYLVEVNLETAEILLNREDL